MKSVSAGFAAVALLVLSSGRPSAAQDHEAHGGAEAHSHKNDLGVFAGATRNYLHETVSFTLGLDYVRKFGPRGEWGVGLVPEYVFADEPELLFLVPVYRLFGSFYVRAGPGVGLLFENEGEGGEVQSTILMRFGFGYGFLLPNRLFLTPSLDVDFGGHRNRAVVLGVTLAKGF